MFRQQHTITEYVTRHITNSSTGELCGLAINSNLTEREVVQSRGVSTTDVSWMDSIVKLMRLHAPRVVVYSYKSHQSPTIVMNTVSSDGTK